MKKWLFVALGLVLFVLSYMVGFVSTTSPEVPDLADQSHETSSYEKGKGASSGVAAESGRKSGRSGSSLQKNPFSELDEQVLLHLDSSESLSKALSNLPLTSDSQTLRKEAFVALLKENPSAAVTLASMIEGMPVLQADQARQALLAALAEVMPETALEYLKEKRLYDNLETIGQIYERLAMDDPAAALERANEAGPLVSREAAYRAMLPHIMGNGLESLSSFKELIDDPVAAYELLGDALMTMAVNRPEEAVRLAMSETHFSRRKELLYNVAISWVDTDPDAFLQFAEKVENKQTRDMLRLMAAEHLAAYDPARATSLIESESNIRLKTSLVGRVAQIMAADDPRSAMDWLSSFDSKTQQVALPMILGMVARADPEFARGIIDGQVADNNLADAISVVVESLAITNPASAMAWADTLHSPLLVDSARSQIYSHWAKNNVQAALDAAYAEARPDVQQLALASITDVWSYDDPQGFLQWATQQQGEYGAFMYEKAVLVLNQMDAVAAAEHFETIVARHTEAGGAADDYVNLSSEISSMMPDPETAFAWANNQKTPAMRKVALEQSAARWAVEDPMNLEQKLVGLEPDAAATIRAVAAREMVSDDPVPALKMAAGIEDPTLRRQSLARTYAHALEISEEKATLALKNIAGVSPEEIQAIIQAAAEYQ